MPQTVDATRFQAAEAAEAADRNSVVDLHGRLRNVSLERDGFEQELYEINRHAAWLSRERQNLLWQIESARVALARAEEIALHQAAAIELLTTESEERQAQIDVLFLRIGKMNRSLSWKVTAPFRDWARRLTRTAPP